jgi:hypothetical protein
MTRYGTRLLLALLVPAMASAQLPEDRAALDRLRDSLTFSWDTAGILQLERGLIERARVERDEPMHHLRLGLLALRLSAIEPSAPHLDHAIGEFEWAAELRPDWPWPWYGIGLAEASGRDRAAGFAGGLWMIFGLDRDQLAGAAFARAIEADAAFVEGLLEFARVALDQRIDAPLRPALEALRAATATKVGWDADLLLARGRLERLAGHPDSARIAFRRAILLGRQTAIGWLELARTIPLTGAMDGPRGAERREQTTRAYLVGAASDLPEIVALYRRDIEPISFPAELAAFDSLRGAARVEWLSDWWRTRDAIDLREPGARLAEHFRRWDVARRDFRLPPFRRRYRFGVELYRSTDGELDDRGIVYVRQGEPTLRIEWPKGRTARRFDADPLRRSYGSETWRYDRPDGALVLHFAAQDDPQDYKLVATPLDLDVALDQLERRAHEVPGLDRLLRAGDATVPWVSEEVRQLVLVSTAIATQTDSWQRHYAEVLAGRVRWYAAGVRDGLPLVHVVYALDAETLRGLPRAADGAAIPVRVRAAFLDLRGRTVATLDTVQFLPPPSAAAQLVAARAEIQVVPGPLRMRLGVEVGPDVGVVYPVDSLVAPRPDATTLEVSAVLLGRAGRSLPWPVTPRDTAWLDAAGVYAPHDTITVYAEGYGITPASRATITVAITRQRGGLGRLLFGNHTALSITERILARDRVVPFRRELDLGGLDPGDYILEVTLTAGGRTVERRRGLTIRDDRHEEPTTGHR